MEKNIKTVLIIDDEEDLLNLLTINLEREGYRVLTADTGEKGLTLAREMTPDLIVLDVILPEMGGWEVCRRLKEYSSTKEIPVFFLTAKKSVEDEMMGISLAASDYITKPFDMDELRSKIKNFLFPRKDAIKKILIVEDDLSIQKLLSAICTREGFSTLVSNDGLEGINMATKELPDLILLDVMLPKINGWEVCRRIKENPETRGIPIIFLTVKRNHKDRLLGISLGAVDYITKPFNIDEVIRSINKQLQTH